VLDPLVTLSWIAGYTQRIGLGTSIVLVPLHHPIHLAKEAATLQELSGGRFRLGIGIGWHEDEFRFIGVPFRERGRRADEALRLIKALWSGEREFHGNYWSFENATSEPLPSPRPEIWVGGGSDRAIRRARELGDVWHPSRSGTPERVREVKAKLPELRVIPRISGPSAAAVAAKIDQYRETGCEGVVASFGTEPIRAVAPMREFADRYRSRRWPDSAAAFGRRCRRRIVCPRVCALPESPPGRPLLSLGRTRVNVHRRKWQFRSRTREERSRAGER
jgi:probable F420-dependent oxidoreductase